MGQRLIDANALLDTTEHLAQVCFGQGQCYCERTKFQQLIKKQPTVDAVPVDFINQKIVELQSCASQHFDDGHEMLATCVLETIRLLGSFLKEWRGKEKENGTAK